MPQIQKLADGVEGLFIKNESFNTTLVSFNFYLPLQSETYAANALLPYVLSSCSARYDSFRKLNIKLGNLYGATVSTGNSKLMDYQWTNISISVINDRYTLNNEKNVSCAAELLASLIFDPALDGDSFREGDVAREKGQMLDRIRGEINDKRGYAISRATALMFGSDPYSMPRYGRLEDMEAVTGRDLFVAWERMLRSAFVRINVVGESLPEGIMEAVGAAFAAIRRENVTAFRGFNTPSFCMGSEKTEFMDVAQGKLVLGFSTGTVTPESESAALAVMADIFGGGPYSRLFTNVREKQSLCYYCACRVIKNKGVMLVDSGVECENAERAQREILKQLEVMQNGGFTDEEFDASVCSICDSIKSLEDSTSALSGWYASRVFDSSVTAPADFAGLIKKVTRQDVINAAKKVSLCTVYKLLSEGKENE